MLKRLTSFVESLFGAAEPTADTDFDAPRGDDAAAAAAAAVDAPIEPTVEHDSYLTTFLQDFLHPIAADGRFDRGSIEETPLIVAFHVYRIDRMLKNNEAEVDRRIRACIVSARTTDPPNDNAEQLQAAWRRVFAQPDAITENDVKGLRDWFQFEATRLGLKVEFNIPDGASTRRKDPLPDDCVERFSRYFHEARQSLASPEADEDAAAAGGMETAAATVAPVEAAPPDDIDGQCSDAVVDAFLSGEFPQGLRDRQDNIVAQMQALLAGDELAGFAFDAYRQRRDEQAIVVRDLPRDAPLWFVGDIHGDLLGLECVVDYIHAHSNAEPTIVFLGDLFDDGHMSYEVLLRVYELLTSKPQHHVLLAGNHDEGLAVDGDGFRSSVWPSNFTDWLNERRDDATVRSVGSLAVTLFQQAPRALFLPDGTMAAHGGVPHTDLHASLKEPADLGGPQCLQDYVWTRVHPRARRRIPNRSTRGCELGREDFENFCNVAATAVGQPVERLVRGHDHIDDERRFARFESYRRNPVLTINTMCHRLAREVFGPYEHTPCVARWRWGEIPEVHCVVIPDDAISAIYPLHSGEATSGAEEAGEASAAEVAE